MLNGKNWINDNRNYIIIGLLSCLAVFFLPMLGSHIGLAFILPNTVAGWVVYLITKGCIVVINLLIFDQFMKRAKINAAQNSLFQEAESIMLQLQPQESDEIPLPAQFYIKKMYRSKMLSTGIFTVLGVFGFTNAVLTFDYVSMLSYIFTILMGLIFGWIAMADAEEIWCKRHYAYAKFLLSKHNEDPTISTTKGETK